MYNTRTFLSLSLLIIIPPFHQFLIIILIVVLIVILIVFLIIILIIMLLIIPNIFLIVIPPPPHQLSDNQCWKGIQCQMSPFHHNSFKTPKTNSHYHSDSFFFSGLSSYSQNHHQNHGRDVFHGQILKAGQSGGTSFQRSSLPESLNHHHPMISNSNIKVHINIKVFI